MHYYACDSVTLWIRRGLYNTLSVIMTECCRRHNWAPHLNEIADFESCYVIRWVVDVNIWPPTKCRMINDDNGKMGRDGRTKLLPLSLYYHHCSDFLLDQEGCNYVSLFSACDMRNLHIPEILVECMREIRFKVHSHQSHTRSCELDRTRIKYAQINYRACEWQLICCGRFIHAKFFGQFFQGWPLHRYFANKM